MRILFLIFILAIAQNGFTQKNAIFLETGGNGGLISLNYERQLTETPELSLRIGIGVSFFEIEEDENDAPSQVDYNLNFQDYDWSVPISFQYLFDVENENYLETGLGYTFQFPTDPGFGKVHDEKATHVFFASVGFRRYFGKGRRWLWKANFTPRLGIIDQGKTEYGFAPWAGISIGKRF